MRDVTLGYLCEGRHSQQLPKELVEQIVADFQANAVDGYLTELSIPPTPRLTLMTVFGEPLQLDRSVDGSTYAWAGKVWKPSEPVAGRLAALLPAASPIKPPQHVEDHTSGSACDKVDAAPSKVVDGVIQGNPTEVIICVKNPDGWPTPIASPADRQWRPLSRPAQ